MSSKKTSVDFEGTLPLAEAIKHLEHLLEGLREGTVRLSRGVESISLTPAKQVDVEIEARQKDDKERLSFELKWRQQPEVPSIEALEIAAEATAGKPE